MPRNQLKPPNETLSEPNFKVSVESKFVTPAGNFLNREICLVCTQEGLPGLFGWKMKAFGLCLPYRGSIRLLCFRFSDGFSGFWPKRVSEHSQTQFYQVYRVKNCATCLLSHTSWKNDLTKLIITSRYKLESFTSFLKFSNFLKITQVARTKSGNVGSGSKLSHAVPRITRCTAISTDGVSDYWISFRHSTGFPYRRVSTDTTFQCAINDSRPQC